MVTGGTGHYETGRCRQSSDHSSAIAQKLALNAAKQRAFTASTMLETLISLLLLYQEGFVLPAKHTLAIATFFETIP
jgi:hypothetical protein